MARPMQNDLSRQSGRDIEPLQDREDFAQPHDSPLGRSLPAREALDIRHPALRSECRATLKEARARVLRPARKRTPLHRARPHHAADARFVSLGCERC
jgi:hypothetical protein